MYEKKNLIKKTVLLIFSAMILLPLINAEDVCESHNYKKCFDNRVYWFNSCSAMEEKFDRCKISETCINAECVKNSEITEITNVDGICYSHSYLQCRNFDDLYWYDSCNHREELSESCFGKCEDGKCIEPEVNYEDTIYVGFSQEEINVMKSETSQEIMLSEQEEVSQEITQEVKEIQLNVEDSNFFISFIKRIFNI